MVLHVNRASYAGGYKIEVTFSDGRTGVADLAGALTGPVFTELVDTAEFARFGVDEELRTVVWSSGADVAPEYLYFLAFKDQSDLQPLFKQWGYLV